MKRLIIKILIIFKGLLLLIRPHLLLGWLQRPLLLMSNTIGLSRWTSENKNEPGILNDFYTPSRDYGRRYKLYEHVIDTFDLHHKPIHYLEFGVSGAYSFRWWLKANDNPQSKFFGFDTFEGLPEDWGTYKKGDMSAHVPDVNDDRAAFQIGLFQESLPTFLSKYDEESECKRIVHLDADLFSSTLYVLTSMHPWLRKGDILLFDEFNVPNHEYAAFARYSESYYVKTRLIGAVNNYYQVALEVV